MQGTCRGRAGDALGPPSMQQAAARSRGCSLRHCLSAAPEASAVRCGGENQPEVLLPSPHPPFIPLRFFAKTKVLGIEFRKVPASFSEKLTECPRGLAFNRGSQPEKDLGDSIHTGCQTRALLYPPDHKDKYRTLCLGFLSLKMILISCSPPHTRR